jgi:cyclopropane fatty-acyl-phospholipid synthase-like methyltransferase
VLELGCGWGLVGIACAKTFQAQVTGLDADAAVFPYLQLHAARNGVRLAIRQGTLQEDAGPLWGCEGGCDALVPIRTGGGSMA